MGIRELSEAVARNAVGKKMFENGECALTALITEVIIDRLMSESLDSFADVLRLATDMVRRYGFLRGRKLCEGANILYHNPGCGGVQLLFRARAAQNPTDTLSEWADLGNPIPLTV